MGDNYDASFGGIRCSATIAMDGMPGKTTDLTSPQDNTRKGKTLQ